MTKPAPDALPPGKVPGRRERWLTGGVAGAFCVVVGLVLVLAIAFGGGTSPLAPPPAPITPTVCDLRAASMDRPWSFERSGAGASPESPFTQGGLWTPPYPSAEQSAQSAEVAGQADVAARLRRVAAQPRAVWLSDPAAPPAELTARVARIVKAAAAERKVAVLVVYAIPLRDCGEGSGGGATSGAAYAAYIEALIAGLTSGDTTSGPGVAVILEPDALGQLDLLPPERQAERSDLLRAATRWLAAVPRVAAYLDGGHSGWVSPTDMVQRLSSAGISSARGFSLNVSNYRRTDDELAYGAQMSPLLGWKSFVVDTSRNGNGPGPADQWCNAPGRALGPAPQATPAPQVDAYLWVKPPGESDGSCRPGQPPAGQFWPEYADELVRNTGG